jgi:hypothetical protein
VSTDAAVAVVESGAGIAWIDLRHDEREGMRLLVDLLHARPDDVDDCFNRLPVPELHATPTTTSAPSTGWPGERTGACTSSP